MFNRLFLLKIHIRVLWEALKINTISTRLAFDMDKAKNFEFGLVYGLWTFSMEFIPE